MGQVVPVLLQSAELTGGTSAGPTGGTGHSRRIGQICRVVGNIAVQIEIACPEAAGVLADEPAGVRVIPAGVVPVETVVGVPHLAGEGDERLVGRVALGGDVPEAGGLQVIDDARRVGAGVVLADVPDGAFVVGIVPVDRAGLSVPERLGRALTP